MLPEDPMILLSFINMKLRDEYSDLDELCSALDADKAEITGKLEKAGFRYDPENHCFK